MKNLGPYIRTTASFTKQLSTLASLILVTFCAPHTVLAQPSGESGGPPPRARDPLSIYREAGINSDQENQIKELAKQFEEANATRLQSVMTQLQEMKELSLKPDPDEQAVIAKQEQISKLQAEMGMERIKLLLKIRHVLNAQQKQKLVEIMQKNMGPPTN